MKKLIKFEQKSDFYFNKGLECAEKGDWLKALSLFFDALEKDGDDVEMLFHIAHAYEQMGLFEFSNGILFEILCEEPYNADAGLLVSKNFAMLGDTFRELYYMGKYSSAENIFEGMEQWAENNFIPSLEQIHPMTQRDREFSKRRAGQLMDRGLIKEARTLLAEVLEYFPDDADAKNNLSKAHIFDEEFDNAVKLAESALADDPDDIFALSNLSVALFMSGKKDEAEAIADRLAATETDNLEDAKRLAKFFCFLGRHADTAYRCRKCLEQTPYDVDYLIFLGIAYYNTRQFGRSKDIFLTLLKLRVSPVVVKYYLDLIEEGAGGELSYDFDLPDKLKENYFKKLKVMDYAKEKDDFSNDLIGWGLRCGGEGLASHILDRLMEADGKSFACNFERMLVSELSPKVKTLALFRLFRNSKRRMLSITKDDYFSEVVWPNRLPPENVRNGFLLACAAVNCCMMDAADITLKMYAAARELSERLAAQDFLTGDGRDNLLAAVIVRNAAKELCDDKTLCGLFDVDYNVLSFFTENFYN